MDVGKYCVALFGKYNVLQRIDITGKGKMVSGEEGCAYGDKPEALGTTFFHSSLHAHTHTPESLSRTQVWGTRTCRFVFVYERART